MSEATLADRYRRVWHQAQAVDGTDDVVADLLDASHVEMHEPGLGRERDRRAGTLRPADRRVGPRAPVGYSSPPSTRSGSDGPISSPASSTPPRSMTSPSWTRPGPSGCGSCSARARWATPRGFVSLCALATRSAAVGRERPGPRPARERGAALLVGGGRRRRPRTRVGRRRQPARRPGRCALYRRDRRSPIRSATFHRRGAGLRRSPHVGISDVHQMRQLGMAARAVGADPLAADYFDGVESELRGRGQLGLLSQVLAVQAAVYLDLGNWRRAGQCLQEGRQLSKDTGQSTWRTGTAVVEAVFESLTGETDLALQHAAEIEAACAGQVAGDFLSLVQLARGVAYLSTGDTARAYGELVRMFDPREPCYHPREQLSAVMFLVEAAAGCGAGGGRTRRWSNALRRWRRRPRHRSSASIFCMRDRFSRDDADGGSACSTHGLAAGPDSVAVAQSPPRARLRTLAQAPTSSRPSRGLRSAPPWSPSMRSARPSGRGRRAPGFGRRASELPVGRFG